MSETGTYTRLLAALLGFWILMRSVNNDSTGRTLIDRIVGNKASKSPLLSAGIPQTKTGAGGVSGAVTNAIGDVGSFTGTANPFPGATGSRLDQGEDLTSRTFLAPFAAKVVVANRSDSGWAGGGYLALRSLSDPSQVIYMAEGLIPSVRVGQTVQAGQRVATPIANPYNGVVGNIESGPADPTNPSRPLAQAVSNPPAVVEKFYAWLRGLGGPQATSTSNAGYA
jgi:hypothetical protein